MIYKGFTIEISCDHRGQWWFRLRKIDSSTFRLADDPLEMTDVVCSPYLDRKDAAEQAKQLIDSGRVV